MYNTYLYIMWTYTYFSQACCELSKGLQMSLTVKYVGVAQPFGELPFYKSKIS